MKPAQDRLAQDLKALKFNDPEVPVISNIDAAPKTTGAASHQALIDQVTGAVQWSRSMQKLIELGVKMFVEVGPGKVLAGLMRQVDRNQTAMNVGDEETLQKATGLFEAATKSSPA
jgi:[acyl-carrier-protein] S-malonyltransferase